MIVTFKTKAYSNITMFGDIAVHLLKMMGQTGKVPGAIKDGDVSLAYQTLKQALERQPEDLSIDQSQESDSQPESTSGYQDKEERSNTAVSLKQRAKPLLDLLEAAAKDNTYVSWE
jgi:DNA-binding SARP family transcriptional activator